jgi:hypothetical protein
MSEGVSMDLVANLSLQEQWALHCVPRGWTYDLVVEHDGPEPEVVLKVKGRDRFLPAEFRMPIRDDNYQRSKQLVHGLALGRVRRWVASDGGEGAGVREPRRPRPPTTTDGVGVDE